jgi:hypothetical protein
MGSRLCRDRHGSRSRHESARETEIPHAARRKDATANPATIKAQWRSNPHADILWSVDREHVVIDLDRKDGKDGVRDFERLTGLSIGAIDTPRATSPRGGVHLYFRANGIEYRALEDIGAPGIDFCGGPKGSRGVVLPGPGNGRQYEKPLTGPWAEAPEFFADLMRQWLAREAARKASAGPQQPHQGQASARATKALNKACKALSEAGPGERDTAIRQNVLKVGSLAATGEIDPTAALDALIISARANPAGSDYADRVRRAFENGLKQPAAPATALEPLDDTIAEIFAAEHADDLRYVAEWGKWYEWRKGCWREEKTLRVFDLIRKTCRAFGIERAGMARTVAAVHTLARADRRIAATAEQWDSDPMLLNTPTGVVDLRTGDARAHDPALYMTKITAIGPRGDCPQFKTFLTTIMQEDAALVDYLKRVIGYCLTGDVSEETLFFFYGLGANGKGVLTRTIARILGEYHKSTPIETFTETRTDRHPTELARLHNTRLVTASETERGRHWAESRLKQLTGSDPVAARFMQKDFFEYWPQFKIVISGNYKPRLRGSARPCGADCN